MITPLIFNEGLVEATLPLNDMDKIKDDPPLTTPVSW